MLLTDNFRSFCFSYVLKVTPTLLEKQTEQNDIKCNTIQQQ